MSQNYQTLEQRKENVSSIAPLISAMRTISLSQWRMALNRQTNLNTFLKEISTFNAILRHNAPTVYAQSDVTDEILIVLGSNRGLCGNFNKHLRKIAAGQGLIEKRFYRVFFAGRQLPTVFRGVKAWDPITLEFPDIKDIQDAPSLFSLASQSELEGKSIVVLYNNYLGAGHYKTVSQQIYPAAPETRLENASPPIDAILDTDPQNLRKILDYLTLYTRLQACFYTSLASEHSSRFALMENADQNIEDLVQELEVLLQDYRKGKITSETQELAVASGLLH